MARNVSWASWTPKIAAHLEELLTDQNAINHLVPMTAGERDLLYQTLI